MRENQRPLRIACFCPQSNGVKDEKVFIPMRMGGFGSAI